MRLWRVTHVRHTQRAWSGEGARQKGGRWHSPGKPVVYASEHAALALLEVLVHVSARDLPVFRLVTGTLPDALVHTVRPEELPSGWDAYPYAPASQSVGDAWLEVATHIALRVPSSLVPGYNVLLNPRHRESVQLDAEPGGHEIPYARRAPP